MKYHRFAAFVLFLCSVTIVQGREIYKCVSADGKTSFVDKPCDKNAKSATEVIIKNDMPSPEDVSRQQTDWKKKSAEFDERQQARKRKEDDEAFQYRQKKADEQRAADLAKRQADEEDRRQREAGARAAARRAANNGF